MIVIRKLKNPMYTYLVKFENRFTRRKSTYNDNRVDYWEMISWVDDNLSGITRIFTNYGWFELEEDVIAFILRWQ